MKYTVPFIYHNKKNNITIEYDKIHNTYESGFHILKLPFNVNECVGYPMLHAYFENLNLKGYERYCGWIQIIKREEFNFINDIRKYLYWNLKCYQKRTGKSIRNILNLMHRE